MTIDVDDKLDDVVEREMVPDEEGEHVTTRIAHSGAHVSEIFSDPFGLRRMAAENGYADWRQWGFPGEVRERDAKKRRCE